MQANQLKPGEDVKIIDNRVQVSGQVAVMNINGLLTKVIFDHNPKNEFFVEESFPLDWMYPYLTPFGVIMKINRQPLPSLTEDILNRDHQFWKQFSKRLTGDIIDYDTPVKQITDWIEKTYLRHDLNGFTGDRKFLHDDDAQKSFSKLRSSIGGIYAWRLSPSAPPEYRPKTSAEYQRLLKEADFTFRQAFAFCPYSPEAVFRYAQLLLQFSRFDDALLVAETCLKLDPYNGQVRGLVDSIQGYDQSYKKQAGGLEQARTAFQQMEDEVRKNPADFQAAFNLAGAYLQMQQTNRAVQVLDGVLKSPQADASALRGLLQAYTSFGNRAGLQQTVDKLEALARANPAKLDRQRRAGIAQAYAALRMAQTRSGAGEADQSHARKPRSLVRPGGPKDPLRQTGGGAGGSSPGTGFERQAAAARSQGARFARQRQKRGALRAAATTARVPEAGAAVAQARKITRRQGAGLGTRFGPCQPATCRSLRSSGPLFPLVGAHQLRLGEDVLLHRALKVLLR